MLTFDKFYSSDDEYKSDSDNGIYLSFVRRALDSPKIFNRFKRQPIYRDILEHLDRLQGQEYLNILQKRNDGLLDSAIFNVLKQDEVGNPIKYRYEGMHLPLSPTTLRYVKVASDLKGMFGCSLAHVAEIGCGYGGQAFVNDQLLSYKHSTLFDLPIVNQLIQKYLNSLLLNGSFAVKTINEISSLECDLVISNYAFSELPAIVQRTYLRKLLSHSPKGYLTMNSGTGNIRSSGKLSLSELRDLLPQFEVFQEEPCTSQNNFILAWGFDKDFVSQHMKRLDI
jgi:putative sugar O-methyltransferase